MLTIRLQRMGKRKNPTYRLIVSEKARDTQYNSLEILGNYNPIQIPKVLELKADRIKYWISKGAQTSNTVNNILVREGIIEGKKRKSVTISNKRKVKIGAKKVELAEKENSKKALVEKAIAEAKTSAEKV
ncbi:MAG: 30S ribosomal protein S16 [Candidatus Magasanikbacteria bacterium CG_4_10_14_0_8_um_filter_32_14]|uniref:Small ribosomal subunit protein bS16 n=1 Tax=Candidatus Magasanikbacteria bacterium CG_4_10_14_0_8_um_filter_32_14 TaxID=1974640 RepID=A0A2M7R8H6_9BACT|nr:MAG: 30S ribosomal protein S16 [Candidatus Magasanikbacteria bacterium CG_4_10_14_0_8_um_filter_32_14]